MPGKTVYAQQERLQRLHRAQRNLYWLAKEILGYNLLTDEFHKPICDSLDQMRRDRVKRQMELWPRGHYKTTIRITQIIQDLLIDPNDTIFICHAVEDEVAKIVQECGTHFQKNTELRKLRMEMMPSTQDRRFLKALQFTVKRDDFAQRQPSVQGKSTGAEITGAHCNRIYLDDIVGRNTIADSGLPRVKSWFKSTVMPVLNPGGTILVTGTRWDLDDPYAAWLKSKDWESRVRAALETDGEPDNKGKPIMLPMREIQLRRRDMGESDFAFQYMNDPSPAGDKPWDPGCEVIIGMRASGDDPGASGPGALFVLSDPAPAKEGSIRQDGEKFRGDGTKDDWAMAVVKLKNHNGMQIGVLLDLSTSKEWTQSEGLDEACRLMRKWGTNKFFNEAYGGLIANYTDEAIKASRRNGVPLYLDKNAQLPAFDASYAKGAKNQRFSKLSGWAKTQRFYICGETVPPDELEKFLGQARTWLPLPNGRNSNRFDDSADAVSRITDPALQRFAPIVQEAPMSPFMDEMDPDGDWSEESSYRSRYTLA